MVQIICPACGTAYDASSYTPPGRPPTGRVIACVRCGAALAVPPAASPPDLLSPPAPPPGGSAYTCPTCGTVYTAPPAVGGRPPSCPLCGAGLHPPATPP